MIILGNKKAGNCLMKYFDDPARVPERLSKHHFLNKTPVPATPLISSSKNSLALRLCGAESVYPPHPPVALLGLMQPGLTQFQGLLPPATPFMLKPGHRPRPRNHSSSSATGR